MDYVSSYKLYTSVNKHSLVLTSPYNIYHCETENMYYVSSYKLYTSVNKHSLVLTSPYIIARLRIWIM
jgi:hypothetical protein